MTNKIFKPKDGYRIDSIQSNEGAHTCTFKKESNMINNPFQKYLTEEQIMNLESLDTPVKDFGFAFIKVSCIDVCKGVTKESHPEKFIMTLDERLQLLGEHWTFCLSHGSHPSEYYPKKVTSGQN